MKTAIAVARNGPSGPRGKGRGNRGGGRFRSRAPRPLRRCNHVALELAHARDLQAARYRILAGGWHPSPLADPLQGRPRREGGKVALEKSEDPEADGGRGNRGEGGVGRGASIRRIRSAFRGNSAVANMYFVQKRRSMR